MRTSKDNARQPASQSPQPKLARKLRTIVDRQARRTVLRPRRRRGRVFIANLDKGRSVRLHVQNTEGFDLPKDPSAVQWRHKTASSHDPPDSSP